MTAIFIRARFWRLLFLLSAITLPCDALRADITGFGAAGMGFSLNGGAAVNNGVATLTDGGINEARSLFYGTRQSIAGFNVSFTYQESASVVATGEGIAFVVQSDSRQAQAVGRNGTSLGYGGGLGTTAVSPSAAVQFNLLNVAGVTASSTGFATNGALTGTPYGLLTSTNLGGGSPIQVNLRYDGATLSETLTNLTSGAVSPTYSYAAGNLANLLGSDTAYVGFTGSTGLLAATQTIGDFSYVAVPESFAWGLSGGGILLLLGASRLCKRLVIG